MFAATEGRASIHSRPDAFLSAFARLVESGALLGRPSGRSRYDVTRLAPDVLQFRAANWLTAINVGLNEVDLSAAEKDAVRYAIRYPRWSRYVFGLGAALGIILLVVAVILKLSAPIPDYNIAIILAMAVFWGFVWPLLLVGLHKIALRRLMSRLIAEVDAGVAR